MTPSLHPPAESRRLSCAEEALWLLQQQRPSGAYNEGVLLRLRHSFKPEELQEVAYRLAGLHPALRTVYRQQSEGPVALVLPAHRSVEIRTCAVDGEAEARQRADADFADPFDLSAGVSRFCLYRKGAECWMLVALHHIACDGWSMQVFQESLSAVLAGQDTDRGEGASYGDFAVAEGNYIVSDRYQRDASYWMEKLEGIGELARLKETQASSHYLCLEESVPVSRQDMDAAAGASGVSRFMLACTAAQITLAQFLDRPDIVLATPFSNRNRELFGHTAGLFTNTLLLRQELRAGETVASLLRRTRASLGGALRRGQYPYSHLMRQARTQLAEGCLPYQLYFSYREAPSELLSNPQFEVVGHPRKAAGNFDLHLEVFQEADRVQLTLHADTGKYEAGLARQVLSIYQRILSALPGNLERPVDGLPALSREEYAHQLILSAGPLRNYAVSAGFAATFTRSRRRHASSMAVSDGTLAWTYEELDRWSDALAAQILSHPSWKKGSVAGIGLPRGNWLVASILATWKAGGVYLPLDPDLPRERLASLVEDSGSTLVISSEAIPSLPAAVKQLTLPQSFSEGLNFSKTAARSSDGAYLLYTSGSTGRPKGVLVAQDGMMNHLLSKLDDLQLGPQTRLAQTASQTFDVSIWQMLAPLLAGGQVCIADRKTVMEPDRLLDYLESEKITIVQMVPSYLSVVLSALDRQPRQLPQLRFLVCAGEALTTPLVQSWQKRFPACPVFNGYGPTEGSDNIAVYTLPAPFSAARVPIGRPLANLHLYLVNGLGQLSPAGALGEIWVSGVGVAKGYWNLPEQTKASFQDDPFQPGRRLFRTGDLGCRNDQGLLEFYGRKDLQVKIRGQRLELEEVEAALRACAPVKETAVRYWPQEGGILAAYLVLEETGVAENELRQLLLDRLPAYMVPSVFQFLEALPRTASGKIARGLLPEPVSLQASYDPPTTPTEKMICAIWEELLPQRPISVTADFFRLGGHSLLLARMSNRIAENTGMVIPFAVLYRLTDIESLSHYLDLQQPVAWPKLEERLF